MKSVNDYSKSIKLEKSRTFFTSMKNNSPDKYSFLLEYGDGDIYVGYTKATSRLDYLKNRTMDIYLSIKDSKNICLLDVCYSAYENGLLSHLRARRTNGVPTKQNMLRSVFGVSLFSSAERYRDIELRLKLYEFIEKNYNYLTKE